MATSLHPFIRPAETYEHPQAPVRDDAAVGPTEDLDRQPDGVPHRVVGLTALLAILLAMALIGVIGEHSLPGRIGAVVVAIGAAAALFGIMRRTTRDRDHIHPSR